MKTIKLLIKILIVNAIITFTIIITSTILLARTKLTTLPERNNVRIDLSHRYSALIEEERSITLQQGVNQIEFAWAVSSINKDSISMRVKWAPKGTKVLNLNFPPNENALYWQVYCPRSGTGIFKISYLLKNINKSVSYEALTDRKEKFLTWKSYVLINNKSKENFSSANIDFGFGRKFKKNLVHGEARKLLSFNQSYIPIKKIYKYDYKYSHNKVKMIYEIKKLNNSKPGIFLTKKGKLRIYQEDRYGNETFLGEDWVHPTRRYKKNTNKNIEAFIGEAKEVKIKRMIYENKTIYVNKPIKNYRKTFKFQMENFKKETVPLKIKEYLSGEWIIEKVVVKEETGERNLKRETIISSVKVQTIKEDTKNLNINVSLPHTKNKKYNLYVTVLLKNRW